jgi:hypothetical protein
MIVSDLLTCASFFLSFQLVRSTSFDRADLVECREGGVALKGGGCAAGSRTKCWGGSEALRGVGVTLASTRHQLKLVFFLRRSASSCVQSQCFSNR